MTIRALSLSSRRTMSAPIKICQVGPLVDQPPYYEWFWFNLAMSLSFYPRWPLEEIVADATLLADKHARDNLICTYHGRNYSADGKCPCEGCPSGVHNCSRQDPRLLHRPPPHRR